MKAPLLRAEDVAALVTRVTRTMLGLPFELAPVQAFEPRLAEHAALMDIRGSRPLKVALSTDPLGSTTLGAAMFACSPAAVDDRMRNDCLGELLNMTAGQIRSALRLDQALGLPHIAAPGVVPQVAPWRPIRLKSRGLEMLVWLTETQNGGK